MITFANQIGILLCFAGIAVRVRTVGRVDGVVWSLLVGYLALKTLTGIAYGRFSQMGEERYLTDGVYDSIDLRVCGGLCDGEYARLDQWTRTDGFLDFESFGSCCGKSLLQEACNKCTDRLCIAVLLSILGVARKAVFGRDDGVLGVDRYNNQRDMGEREVAKEDV